MVGTGRWSAQEGETMSTLHRLKAYFGMVPADELDAAQFGEARFSGTRFDAARFDEAQLGEAELDGYHPAYRSDYPASVTRHPARPGFDDYDRPASAGRYAASGAHPARYPSASLDAQERSFRAAESWGADAPMRGSLAIDTAAVDTAAIDTARIDS